MATAPGGARHAVGGRCGGGSVNEGIGSVFQARQGRTGPIWFGTLRGKDLDSRHAFM